MNDSKVSLNTTLAWATWALSGLFALLCLVVDDYRDQTTIGGMVLCTISIILAAAAATIHTRSFLCEMWRCEKDAFELGKDAGRLESVPTQRGR